MTLEQQHLESEIVFESPDLPQYAIDNLLSLASRKNLKLHRVKFDLSKDAESPDGTIKRTIAPVTLRKAGEIKIPDNEGSIFYLLGGNGESDYLVESKQTDTGWRSVDLRFSLWITEVPSLEETKNRREWKESVLSGRVRRRSDGEILSSWPGTVLDFDTARSSIKVRQFGDSEFLNDLVSKIKKVDPKQGMSPKESEAALLKMFSQKKGISFRDVLNFIDEHNGPNFGPSTDVLDVIQKFLDLGIIEYNDSLSKFEYRGFNELDNEEARVPV